MKRRELEKMVREHGWRVEGFTGRTLFRLRHAATGATATALTKSKEDPHYGRKLLADLKRRLEQPKREGTR